MDITFVTSNAAKAAEVGRYVSFPLKHQGLDIPEIQSLSLREVVQHKTEAAFTLLKRPVLVEDTALTFTALKKLPGPFIKWFLQELGNDGLCTLVNTLPSRQALASVAFGLHDGQTIHIFEGSIAGSIAPKPSGNQNFGWDPIFIPDGFMNTWGQMSAEEKEVTSMRKVALQKLEDFVATR